MGRAHAGGLRVLGQALSEVHAPEDVQASALAGRPAGGGARNDERAARRARAGPTTPTSTSSAAASTRSPRRQARRAARAVSGQLQGRAGRRATTLSGCCSAFAGYPVAVELRHRSWSDGIAETLALLNGFGAAWVQIDEPKFRFSIRQNYLPNVEGFYYMRLHGRNAAKWWRHEKSEDRYDYLYSADELKEFSETADAREAAGEEAVSLHQQPLLGEVGRQRRDDQAAARRADRGRVSAGVHRALPGARQGALTPSRTLS